MDWKAIIKSLSLSVLALLLVVGVVYAVTSIGSNITTDGDLTVDGDATLGTLTVDGDVTLENGETISNSTNGAITLGADNLVLVGTASTSALKVGDEVVSTINGLIFGFCTIADTNVTASSSAYAACAGATGVLNGDRVFVQATSSLNSDFYVTSASSTATAGTIGLRIHNSGNTGQSATGVNSLNFWAVRP
jgi:hypothetical protein